MLCIVQNFRITETPFTLTPRRWLRAEARQDFGFPPRLLRFLVTIAGGNCSIPPPQVSQSVCSPLFCPSFSVSTGLSLNVDLCVCVCACANTQPFMAWKGLIRFWIVLSGFGTSAKSARVCARVVSLKLHRSQRKAPLLPNLLPARSPVGLQRKWPVFAVGLSWFVAVSCEETSFTAFCRGVLKSMVVMLVQGSVSSAPSHPNGKAITEHVRICLRCSLPRSKSKQGSGLARAAEGLPQEWPGVQTVLDSALSFEKPKKRLLRVFGLRCGFVYWLDEASPARGHPGQWSLCAEVAPKAIWARPSGDKHSPPPEMSQHAPHDMANGASRCHCRF